MADEFHLIDLVSQAGAVEQILHGKSKSEKLTWLQTHGKLTQMEKKMSEWPETYFFESRTGARCAFIFHEETFHFVGSRS